MQTVANDAVDVATTPSGFTAIEREEIPMTMQVGMVGSDGILLASDTYGMNPPTLGRDHLWAGVRYSTNNTKIKVSHESGIAIACAWDMITSGLIADSIISGWTDDDLADPEGALERLCENVADKEKRRAQCLVVLTRPTPQMFFLQSVNFENEWSPWCQKMLTKAITGDNVNAAIFWAERYYEKFLPLHLSMERLIPLAAQMIVSARELNTAGIGGLEIVLCGSSRISLLSDDSIDMLKQRALEWDETIGDLFLSYQPPYTYKSPNIAQ